MSDLEILALLSRCKSKGDLPWNVLVNQFARQLVALSGRIGEQELYALLDIAFTCYQKGCDEFVAHREAQHVINEIRVRSRRAPSLDK
jgi:hypothetical protein